CAPCYAEFAKGSGREHKLANAAGRLGQVVDPEHLQALWKRVPARLRARARGSARSLTSEEDVKRRQMAVKAAFQRMDLRVAPSRFLASIAEEQDMGTVLHLPHGVPLTNLPEWPRDGLLFLGTLAPHKGPDLVVQACERLGLRSSLRLVGPAVDPSFQATLPAELIEPPLTPDQVPERLRRSRLLILGSRWPENAPLVILEARAQGTPIVAPRIGGIPELLQEGVDGLLYKVGDAEDCARAIHQALDLDLSPRLPDSQKTHLDRLECHYRGLLV
ncbi:MAG: glycosyltransferase involved in cell wall biosynthesis, partial [Cognaticolwellia sp.]